MKICVAQTRPVKGDIRRNIDNHKKIITESLRYKTNTIIFPELSLTGYEPALSKELAIDLHDNRIDCFQKFSDDWQVTIGVGAPLKNSSGINISMIIFQPRQERELYIKNYLHPDEEEFFTGGQEYNGSSIINSNIALAICYELSVPEHPAEALNKGAEIYLASAAKSIAGVQKAIETLSGIAKKYSMTVLFSNCVGYCDNFESGGKSSIWNNKGVLAGQLNDDDEGILILDTETQEVIGKKV